MRASLCLIVACALAAGAAAEAADLAAQRHESRIGVVFADPPPPARVVMRERPLAAARYVYAPDVDIRPIVNGYYGKPNAYRYDNYYGTSPVTIFSRLPYACGWHGYC